MLMGLCRLLSGAPLTMDDVRRELAGVPVEAAVQPVPGTDTPAFVRLYLPEPGQLTLDTLRETFGPYKKTPRLHRNAPDHYIIYVDLAGYPYRCALIAAKKLDQPAVQTVTVRRDIRLG